MRFNRNQRASCASGAIASLLLLLFPPTMIGGEAGLGQGRGHRFLLHMAAEFDPMLRIDGGALAAQLLCIVAATCFAVLASQDS